MAFPFTCNLFPSTDFNKINLDWICDELKVDKQQIAQNTADIEELQDRLTTIDYEDLQNLPKINDVTLIGNKSLADIGAASVDELGFVTPEMYGAKGDGVTDDSSAFTAALSSGKNIMLSDKTYKLDSPLIISGAAYIIGSGMRDTTLLFDISPGDYAITVNGCPSFGLKDLTITGASPINAIHFTVNRCWYTDVSNVYLDNLVNGVLIDTATGYNVFSDVQFIPGDNNFIGVEIGSSGYSQSIQPNYITFTRCYFGNAVNFGANAYTDVLIHNAQHITFNECDFVAANRAIHITDSLVTSRDIRVINSRFFAPFTALYATNNKTVTSLCFMYNVYVVQTNQLKMIHCDGNTGFLNFFRQTNETIINAGGTLASEMYTLNNVYKCIIKDVDSQYSGYFYTHNIIPTGAVYRVPAARGNVSGSLSLTLYCDGLGYAAVPSIFVGSGVTYTVTPGAEYITIDFSGTGMYTIA